MGRWKTPEELKEYVVTYNRDFQYDFTQIDEEATAANPDPNAPNVDPFDYISIHEELQKFTMENENLDLVIDDEDLKDDQYKFTIDLLARWLKCSDGTYGCPPCRRKIRKKDFNLHLKTEHFFIKSKRKYKVKPVPPESDRTCEVCHLVLASTSNLKKHFTSFHKPTKDFKCEECSMEFHSKARLSEHINAHHTKSKCYPCPFCKKLMYSSDHRRNHIRTHHRKTRPYPYPCDLCDKAFLQPNILKKHKLSHSSQKDFECPTCQKKFKSPLTLKSHQKTHRPDSERRKHECNFCHKMYFSKHALRVHWSCHTGERPYECRFCGDGFKLPGHLTQHYLKHTQEKPYTCHICDKAFGLKHQRDNHLKTHGTSSSSSTDDTDGDDDDIIGIENKGSVDSD